MFELFEHRADIGIRGTGPSMEDAFEEAGKALFSIVTEVEKIRPAKRIPFSVTGLDRENLFINYLNELIYLKDAKNMVFNYFKINSMKEEKGNWKLEGYAFGSEIDEKTPLKGDVKAASYAQLKVGKEKGLFVAQCIVDV